jgi:hypothetical protein
MNQEVSGVDEEELLKLLQQTRERVEELENEKSEDDLKSKLREILMEMKQEDDSDDLGALREVLFGK